MHRHYLIASQVWLHLRSLDNSILSLVPHSHSRRPNSIISWQEECGMWGGRGRQGGNDDDDDDNESNLYYYYAMIMAYGGLWLLLIRR
jgi:hypothetical protein